MNVVLLTGRLATEIESEEIIGNTVARFILAVPRNEEEDDFFRVKAWNSQAQAACAELRKGSKVAVEGSLRQDLYTSSNGTERPAVVIMAKRIEYL